MVSRLTRVGVCDDPCVILKVDCRPPFLIGVAGGTASGKTSVCHKIIELLSGNYSDSGQRVVLLSQDSFYKNLSPEQHEKADQGLFNFDHPGIN